MPTTNHYIEIFHSYLYEFMYRRICKNVQDPVIVPWFFLEIQQSVISYKLFLCPHQSWQMRAIHMKCITLGLPRHFTFSLWWKYHLWASGLWHMYHTQCNNPHNWHLTFMCLVDWVCDGLITHPEESYCVSVCVWLRYPKKGGQRYVLDYKRLWMNGWLIHILVYVKL
jgi:hypothetical protein